MRIVTTRLLLLLLILLPHVAPAQSAPVFSRADGKALTADQIDTTVQNLMRAGRVPGLALTLIADDRIAYLRAFGMADVAAGRSLQTDTVMYGASLTKAAFAYMVMTLVDKGVVDLDRPIAEYLPKPLPQYENYADLAGDDRWRAWTLRMLLSHQAGLPNWRWFSDSQKLAIIFEPGSRYAYSGEGYQVAQLTLEQGLGLNVNELMRKRVFERFGMHRTSMTWREDFRPNFAHGYAEDGRDLGHNARRSVHVAGSMDTTVADFAAFLAGVLRGDGLSLAARSQMLGAQVSVTARHQFPTQSPEGTDANQAIGLSYGLGWGLFQSPFGPAFFKEGHDDGTNNYALCLEEAKRCILILSNSSNGEGIFLYLADALLGKTGLPWEWEGYVPYDRKPGRPDNG